MHAKGSPSIASRGGTSSCPLFNAAAWKKGKRTLGYIGWPLLLMGARQWPSGLVIMKWTDTHSQGPRRFWRSAQRCCRRASRAMRVRHQAAFSARLSFCVCMLAPLSSSSAASSSSALSPAACACCSLRWSLALSGVCWCCDIRLLSVPCLLIFVTSSGQVVGILCVTCRCCVAYMTVLATSCNQQIGHISTFQNSGKELYLYLDQLGCLAADASCEQPMVGVARKYVERDYRHAIRKRT